MQKFLASAEAHAAATLDLKQPLPSCHDHSSNAAVAAEHAGQPGAGADCIQLLGCCGRGSALLVSHRLIICMARLANCVTIARLANCVTIARLATSAGLRPADHQVVELAPTPGPGPQQVQQRISCQEVSFSADGQLLAASCRAWHPGTGEAHSSWVVVLAAAGAHRQQACVQVDGRGGTAMC